MWQPIETAPKDGSEIDLFGHWRDKQSQTYRLPEAEWVEPGFWRYDADSLFENHIATGKIVLTHWMPRPKDPS